MQVLHLISNRDNSGGSIAAKNLHEALLKEKYHSELLSTDQLAGDKIEPGYRRFGGITGRIQQAFLKLESMLSLPGQINPIDKWLMQKELKGFNGVLHIHVTHVAQISFDLINWLAEGNKVFWTLHDLWPLTGKCIHPTYCQKWLQLCNNCPKCEEYPLLKRDSTPFLHRKKNEFINRNKVHFISPSYWIDKLAKNHIMLYGGNLSTIPHSINTEIFKYQDKQLSRSQLSLNLRGLFILFPQGRWDDKKKGTDWYFQIKDALTLADKTSKKINLVRIYGEELQIKEINPFLTEISLPKTNAKNIMASYYQIADVSVSVSEVETFGMCVAESLACKVPVIARRANGITELLADDPTILADHIEDMIQLIILEKWKDFDYTKFFNKNYTNLEWARKHIELYEA